MTQDKMIQDPNLEMMTVMMVGVIRNVELPKFWVTRFDAMNDSVSDDLGLFKFSALIKVKFQCD